MTPTPSPPAEAEALRIGLAWLNELTATGNLYNASHALDLLNAIRTLTTAREQAERERDEATRNYAWVKDRAEILNGQYGRWLNAERTARQAAESRATALEGSFRYLRDECAEIADAVADEKDVMALSSDESNFAAYREGERRAKQIAVAIRALAPQEPK